MASEQDLIGTAQSKGRRLTAWLSAGVLAASYMVFALSPDPVVGARMVIRLTARTSLLLFAIAFTASSLASLFHSPTTARLSANRKYFGLGFVFSHLVHAAGITALSQLDPELFGELTTPASFIAGGLGYTAIVVMFATSFNRVAAALGPKSWRIANAWSGWFLALFFAVNFGRRAVIDPQMYWPYMALIFAAIAVRLVTMRRRAGASPV